MPQRRKDKAVHTVPAFPNYAARSLWIRTKQGTVAPFRLNAVQRKLHARLEDQRQRTGRIRALILKARQPGVSTYVEGRFYWQVTHRCGVRAFILTHLRDATDAIFEMVQRFHDRNPREDKPHTGASNAKELFFDETDSGYRVGTAGSKAIGRGHTLQYFHGSEVAHWPNGGAFPANAHEAALDLLTMMIQKHSAEILRSLIFPISDPQSAIASLPSSASRANQFLAFDAAGKPIASAGLAGESNVPVSAFMETVLDDGDGEAALTTLINSATAGAVRGLLELGTAAVGDIGTDILAPDGDGSALSGVVAPGKNSIWIPASAMLPTESNGCASLVRVETTAGRPDLHVLNFDASADEHAQFSLMLPKSWNEGTVTFRAVWTTTGAVTTGVAIGLQAVSVADDETVDVAFGTPALVTDDALGAAEDIMVTDESAAITIGGTTTCPSIQYFDVFRDVSDANDDMTEDMRLIGVILHFTTDVGTDA